MHTSQETNSVMKTALNVLCKADHLASKGCLQPISCRLVVRVSAISERRQRLPFVTS
jgi:hypothetical protein